MHSNIYLDVFGSAGAEVTKVEDISAQRIIEVVVYLFQQSKQNNFNIISLTKPGNQNGKCPFCWPPTAQTK